VLSFLSNIIDLEPDFTSYFMTETSKNDPVPKELLKWAQDVKVQNLRVESAMIAVVGLAYKTAEHERSLKPHGRDLQRQRLWLVKKRKLRRAMNHALKALQGALEQEYGSTTQGPLKQEYAAAPHSAKPIVWTSPATQ
jgi:hypothetical protein